MLAGMYFNEFSSSNNFMFFCSQLLAFIVSSGHLVSSEVSWHRMVDDSIKLKNENTFFLLARTLKCYLSLLHKMFKKCLVAKVNLEISDYKLHFSMSRTRTF